MEEDLTSTNDNLMSFLTNHFRNVLSSSRYKENSNSKYNPDRKINMTVTYHISNVSKEDRGSLIDRGANGGLACNDVRIISRHNPPRYFDISELNSHQIKDLEIVTAGGEFPSQHGPVIEMFYQYAYLGSGNTIHSCIQLESYKNKVDDKTIFHEGTHTITTIDDYIDP